MKCSPGSRLISQYGILLLCCLLSSRSQRTEDTAPPLDLTPESRLAPRAPHILAKRLKDIAELHRRIQGDGHQVGVQPQRPERGGGAQGPVPMTIGGREF